MTKVIRCAIYTRKSTSEGLEQEFNSLDAQREAAEAYIISQKHEGWELVSEHYDDGGFTGGNMDRPAMKRLMADVAEGKIDCIVVYKVDRLSRSLLDFTSIMAVLEKHGVSFVSVTQQFNTTSSMGRLTLNILLSFAQFEREIISERTRDKIAAARRKGKWSGGRPILGFDVDPAGGRIVVNEAEAAKVRAIFELYLKCKGLVSTVKEIQALGWTNKKWTTKKGIVAGGNPFTKSSLSKLLANVLYIGKITYKHEIHEGEHSAIVDKELFLRVQKLLKRNRLTGGRHLQNKYGALLKGLINCKSCECGMVHAYTTKKNKRYRYYVCMEAQRRGWHTCPTKSVPALEIENFVVDQVRCIGRDKTLLAETLKKIREQGDNRIQELEAEKKALDKELRRLDRELRKLAGSLATNKNATDMMAELQERITKAQQRSTLVKEELILLSREALDEDEVAKALTLFDPVWEALTPQEQARILKLLIQRVDYDGEQGTVSVTFHPAGIKTLAEQLEDWSE